MKCQKCKKNEANVKITEIINNNKMEMYLCDECAKEVDMPNIKFDIDNFFSGFFNSWPKMLEKDEVSEGKCDLCGYTFEDFVKYGQLGCPHCYDALSNNLDYVFEKMHGRTRHIGKKSSNIKIGDKIKSKAEVLKSQKDEKIQNKIIKKEEDLRKSILEERYEDAAKLRDEIKKLKEDILKSKEKEG